MGIFKGRSLELKLVLTAFTFTLIHGKKERNIELKTSNSFEKTDTELAEPTWDLVHRHDTARLPNMLTKKVIMVIRLAFVLTSGYQVRICANWLFTQTR